jgi:hypothetical protein
MPDSLDGMYEILLGCLNGEIGYSWEKSYFPVLIGASGHVESSAFNHSTALSPESSPISLNENFGIGVVSLLNIFVNFLGAFGQVGRVDMFFKLLNDIFVDTTNYYRIEIDGYSKELEFQFF